MMIKKLLTLLLVCFMLAQPAYAFSVLSDDTQNILKDTWDAQTLKGLENGIIAVPESALNEYVEGMLPDHPDIRAAHVAVHTDNKLALDIDTKGTGRMTLEGTVTRFVQNSDESAMSIQIGKRKMLDKPITSWFFSHISLGMLTKLFGNPLNDGQEKFVTKIHGNTLDVNFQPYISRSTLSRVSVGGLSLFDLFSVDSLTTEEGVVYLHTTWAGSSFVSAALHQIVD